MESPSVSPLGGRVARWQVIRPVCDPTIAAGFEKVPARGYEPSQHGFSRCTDEFQWTSVRLGRRFSFSHQGRLTRIYVADLKEITAPLSTFV